MSRLKFWAEGLELRAMLGSGPVVRARRIRRSW